MNLQPRADDSVAWLEMVVDRILILGGIKPNGDEEERARARQLEGTLRLLSDTLVYEHRGLYDHLSTSASFIGLLNEAQARDHKTFRGDTPPRSGRWSRC